MISRRNLLAGLSLAAAWPGAAIGAGRRVFRASIALEESRVLVAVGMVGKGPYIFMIDTGADFGLIHNSLATTLKLPIGGHTRVRGMGGADIYPIYEARDFVIGGTMRQARVALVGAGELHFGADIEGTLAAGIITAGDTDLDFDAGEIRLYPDGRGERDGFTKLNSSIRRLNGRTESSPYIFADVAVGGQAFECMLDTGAPNLLTLSPNAARRAGLWDDSRPYAPFRPGGIGGSGSMNRLVRVPSLALGGLAIDAPLVALEPLGTVAPKIGEGIAGLALIRRFNLSIDARSRSLWVQPSRQPAVGRRYGLSGLWLDRKSEAAEVAAVGTGSPAAEAGVQVGDRIAGAWPELLAAINRGPGTPVSLAIERGGTKRTISFTLRPYL
ncbi:aspartyl protease family protein [Sphingomonas sp. AR_OL41]|jgi:serine protease Do|uniref:aspartyl protease family protein n=1 Tax=Sphingomonas sp. AR_OL41 TaxID=3042729 RepID=UPI00248030B1|nr:aspartyl protease family protein [Sphingomonas sp. AR_OL41]MDH7976062.1 aspartyl protease family protein [Sphingomonas sp. AR_OL41]